MRKEIATFLLVFYMAALIRPLMPCINDALAHTFWKSEHLATVHFENGKYHLHLDMQKNGKQDQDNSGKNSEGNIFHLKASSEKIRSPKNFTDVIVQLKHELPSPVFLFVTSPPPWQC